MKKQTKPARRHAAQNKVTATAKITPALPAGEALRENEERFRRAVVDSPFPILLHAEDGAIIQVSQSWCDISGYSREELATIGDWTERAYGERKSLVQADIDALYRLDHRKYEGDYTIHIKDGGTRIWEFSSAPLGQMPDGRRLVISMAMDVTERRQAEAALAIHARIAAIFLTTPDDEMFNEVLKIILDVMRSPLGIFGYIDEDGANVVPTMTRQVWDKCQVPDKTFVFPRATWGDSSWPLAIREKKVNCSNEVSTKTPEGHVTVTRHISLPILFQDEVIGLLQVANKETDYTEADVRTLETIAAQVAPLLSARLRREQAEAKLRVQLHELQRWHDATLGRERRIQELKREINRLLVAAGQPPRFASVSGEGEK
jgi:PAS domain S-box-containing protein